ncbi:UPAR/Ly6 domain-containing protein cold-like [Planococcus citri]|uniref:UPAR/Ly6 domain-containing protein cold-like n=1 Tax=Planococcus citri TaxID=170843 RepID=UPI0031F930B9
MAVTKLYYSFIICSIFSTSFALECYVCTNQQDNHEKCLNTIKTCEQGEEMCLSEIKWGSPPYWSRGSEKQYYVSKRCATRDNCTRIISKAMSTCNYIWYLDWKCAECCAGDRCNYYVTLTGSSIRFNVFVTSICASVGLLIGKFLF